MDPDAGCTPILVQSLERRGTHPLGSVRITHQTRSTSRVGLFDFGDCRHPAYAITRKLDLWITAPQVTRCPPTIYCVTRRELRDRVFPTTPTRGGVTSTRSGAGVPSSAFESPAPLGA